jgi:uncharacterized membrane protein YfcA
MGISVQILIQLLPAHHNPTLPPATRLLKVTSMTKLCILVVSAVAGYGAWWLADAAGLGFFGAFLVSGLGSMVGVWLGWKLAQKLE